MSWLSDSWNTITGKTAAQNQQQMIALQQQQYQQQAAQAAQAQAQMAAQEAQRQAAITGGTSAIDQAFSQFNEPFFQGAQQKYMDYYLPQIDTEAAQTRDKLTAQLAQRGMLESTVGANTLGLLEKKRLDERARIGNEATGFANDIRNQVTSNRNSLYDYARSAADPYGAAARATGEATTLAQAPGGYTSKGNGLGDVFSSMLMPVSSTLIANSNRYPQGYSSAGSGGGSSVKNWLGF